MDGKEHDTDAEAQKDFLFISILFVQAGLASALVQVIPQGIVSVNGSSTTMGCTSPLVERDGVEVCRSQSYLVDGCSPDINTSSPDCNLTSTSGLYFFNEYVPFSSNSSCDSLTTFTMSSDVLLVSPYHMFHFLMTFHGAPSAEWVHLGEIRFLDRSYWSLVLR